MSRQTNQRISRRTVYELTSLRNISSGEVIEMLCSLPMNTPLMLVRTKGKQLGFKRLRTPQRAKIRPRGEDNQISLL